MADGSILTLLIDPAVVGGAVAAILGPVLTALNARKLWVFQQRLDVYSTVCDYGVTVERVAGATCFVTERPAMLPPPPDLLAGRVALLASKRVEGYWREYSSAVHVYNCDVSAWHEEGSYVDNHGRTLFGLSMTSVCREGNGLPGSWRTTERARRWAHTAGRAGSIAQQPYWWARSVLHRGAQWKADG